MTTTLNRLLHAALKANHLALSQAQQDQLVAYIELIKSWNKVFNLTTILDPEEMVYLHLIDSLVIHPYVKGKRMLDVGTGAGLPGIPLAIMNPQQSWVLLDKNNKKTRFLTQVIAELGLSNVEVIHKRSEEYQPGQCFDTIVSRALSALDLFVTTTQHLLCQKGQWLAMKGKHPADEISQLPGRLQTDVIQLEIKGIQAERHLVIIAANE